MAPKKNSIAAKLVSAALTISLIFSACNTSNKETGPEAIRQVINNFHEGLKKGDSVKLRAVCTKDFRLVEDSVIYNTDSIIRYLGNMPKYTVNFEFSDYTAILDQQTAILTYTKKLTLTMNNKTEASNRFESAFLVKENNEWKLYLLHSSVKK